MPNRISWGALVQSICVVSCALFLGRYLLIDYHPYFDLTNCFLYIVLSASVFAASGNLSIRFPLFRQISLVVIVFFNIRLLALMYFPDWLFLGAKATFHSMYSMMLYVAIGTIVAYIAIAMAHSTTDSFKKYPQKFVVTTAQFKFLAWFSITCSLLLLFDRWVFGYTGSNGSSQHMNFFSRYVLRLCQPMVAFILAMVAYRLLPKKTNLCRRMMQFTLLSLVLVLTMTGSRAGIYEVVVLYIALVPTTQNNLYIPIDAAKIFGFIVLLALTPFFFELASNLRSNRYAFDNITFYAVDSYHPIFEAISRRVSLVESTMFPVAQEEMGFHDVSSLVNVETTFYSTMNRVLPGTPFGDILGTEFVWCNLIHKNGCMIYDSLERTDYVGYEWGMYGISYQLFGWVGGIAFIFLSCFLIAFAVQMLKNRNSLGSLSAYTLGAYALQFWVKSLGVDNWIDRFFHQFIFLGLYCLLFSYLTHRGSRGTRFAMDARPEFT